MDAGLTGQLRERVLAYRANLVGFADIAILPEGVREGFSGAISIAIAHDPKIIESIKDGPNMKYAEAYDELNGRLNSIVESVSGYIQSIGYKALPKTATVAQTPGSAPQDDFDPLNDIKASLPHKTIATLSGLGWIGNTDLLITKEYGPRVRLATILTDAPIDYDIPITKSRCGKCIGCVTACPVDAGRKENWEQGSRERYDVISCDRYTRTISGELNLGHQLCGICIAACPVGKRLDDSRK